MNHLTGYSSYFTSFCIFLFLELEPHGGRLKTSATMCACLKTSKMDLAREIIKLKCMLQLVTSALVLLCVGPYQNYLIPGHRAAFVVGQALKHESLPNRYTMG